MCFAMSVATTRYMIQDEMRIQTTKCVPMPVCVCVVNMCSIVSRSLQRAGSVVLRDSRARL